MIRIIASNIVTAVLVSAFWIVAYNMTGSGSGEVQVAGDQQRVGKDGRITIAEGVVVGPSGLAIPVAGIRPNQLVDTFTQARAGGARVHDAIENSRSRIRWNSAAVWSDLRYTPQFHSPPYLQSKPAEPPCRSQLLSPNPNCP